MKFASGLAALLTLNLAQAAIPIDGLYTTVFGGYTYIPNNIYRFKNGLLWTHANYRPGFDAGGSVGFKGTPMRYEGEITYLNANLKKFNVNRIPQTGIGGYSNGVFALANVYYDFPSKETTLQPFLGLGIGYGWINVKLNSSGPLNTTRFKESNSVFAYQGAAGLTFNFTENYALNIGYRYIATTHASNLGKIFQAQLANVGAIYRFDECRYK